MKTLLFIVIGAVVLLTLGFIGIAAFGGGALLISLAKKAAPTADKIHEVAKAPKEKAEEVIQKAATKSKKKPAKKKAA